MCPSIRTFNRVPIGPRVQQRTDPAACLTRDQQIPACPPCTYAPGYWGCPWLLCPWLLGCPWQLGTQHHLAPVPPRRSTWAGAPGQEHLEHLAQQAPGDTARKHLGTQHETWRNLGAETWGHSIRGRKLGDTASGLGDTASASRLGHQDLGTQHRHQDLGTQLLMTARAFS